MTDCHTGARNSCSGQGLWHVHRGEITHGWRVGHPLANLSSASGMHLPDRSPSDAQTIGASILPAEVYCGFGRWSTALGGAYRLPFRLAV